MAAVAESPPLLGRQAPVASRPRRVPAAGHAGVRLAAFAALALLVCERYASLDLTPPRGRVLVAVLIATVTAAALIAAAGLQRRRPAGEPALSLATGAVCGLVLLAGLWAGMRAVGVPGHLLWPGHWGTLHTHVGDGLNGLSGWLWPYRGGERWARIDVLMVIPLVLTAAAALAFWPGAGVSTSRRTAALVLLVALYLAGVVNASHAGWPVEGVLLLAAIASWLFAPRLEARAAVAGGAWLLVAAALAIAGAWVLIGGRPWLDYRAWNPTGTVATSFQWDQSYGPITWSRSSAKMIDIAAAAPELWKVTALDRFDGRRFVRSAAPPGGFDFGSGPGDGRWYYQATFTVDGLRSRQLTGAGSAVEVGWLSTDSHDVVVSDDETAGARSLLAPGDKYQLTFYSPHPAAAAMRQAPRTYPRPYLYYTDVTLPRSATTPGSVLQAPAPGVAPAARRPAVRRVLASPYAPIYRLARELARGQRTPYDIALRIQSFLKQSYAYDERPPLRQLPLLSFLFTDRRGYCQQFSGAMALMLRMVGIPARVAAGFLPGTRDPATGSFRVRALDAHSWVEVYFSGIGWVDFDPTPPRRTVTTPDAFASPTASEGLLLLNRAAGGSLQLPPRRPEPGVGRAPRTRTGGGSGGWLVAAGMGLAILVAVGVWLLRGARRVRRALAGDAAGAVRELGGALRALGYPVAARTTLAQLERRLATTRGPDAARYIHLLSRRCYGGIPADAGPSSRERSAFRRAIAQGRGPVARLVSFVVLPPAL